MNAECSGTNASEPHFGQMGRAKYRVKATVAGAAFRSDMMLILPLGPSEPFFSPFRLKAIVQVCGGRETDG
jgi:hypothetical protein